VAKADGTFGSRFDDPSQAEGRVEADRFRVIYCATTTAAAFGETIAGFLPPLHLLAKAERSDDRDIARARAAGLIDPENPRYGIVPEWWQVQRQLGQTVLAPVLRFVDLAAGENIHHLRRVLAAIAVDYSLHDFDFGTLIGPERRLSQAAARYIFDQVDDEGEPLFAGIRYVSRLNPAWECWAVFADRMLHQPGETKPIFPDDPGLREAAALLGLTIEVGAGRYRRPWR
jgi:hypothetical protein